MNNWPKLNLSKIRIAPVVISQAANTKASKERINLAKEFLEEFSYSKSTLFIVFIPEVNYS